MSVKCYFNARFSAARRGVLQVVNLVDNHFRPSVSCLQLSVKMAAFLPWRDKQELTSRPGCRIQNDTLRHVKAVKAPKRGGSGACACARARTRGPGASFTPLRPLPYPHFGPSSTPKHPRFTTWCVIHVHPSHTLPFCGGMRHSFSSSSSSSSSLSLSLKSVKVGGGGWFTVFTALLYRHTP